MLVSIDLSLRSTGVCITCDNGILENAALITPSAKEYNDEELLIYISDSILEFISPYKITAIVIEGLSFNSFSSEKDKINGNFWKLRCDLKERYPDIPIGIVPVTSWRNWVLSKQEQREIKASKDKAGLKKACVAKLLPNVKETFEAYIKENKLGKNSIYDLTDAYLLGQYRLSLGI